MTERYYLDFNDSAPSHLAAECAILGSVLMDDSRLAEISTVLCADDFWLASHQRIFTRMLEMKEAKKTIDLITISDWKEIQEVGGVTYVSGLTEGLYRNMALAEYIAIVKEKSQLRKLMQVCVNAYKIASAQNVEAKEIGRDVVRELKKVFGGK